ncbi:MAG: methylated-DNA--[protein]-cysteine S-methyltransferase [Dehalococcoidia bacterium]|mgnify:FL=1|jgi:O-6-methylguanine DNA methyltransferase|tara:strand:- start:1952 stop:2440 length:489 start_codon:yes stop_codon:yes gene_type:complete
MNGYYHKIDSPIGPLHLAATNDALLAIHHNLKRMEDWNKNTIAFKNDKNIIIEKTINELSEYFDGKRKKFNIPIQLSGTQFQLKAWDALNKIPYAKTVSYSEQAKISGNPKATRAIGNANNANPISIIVPCHRVIGKSGKLVGYGGGLDRKNYLLDLELKYD